MSAQDAVRMAVTPEGLVRSLVGGARFGPHVTHTRALPARDAEYGPWPRDLTSETQEAARALGIDRLYRHQAAAVEAALEPGPHGVAVASSTASGKSLCYTLPVVNAALRRPGSRALLLFPTKALAHDQLSALQRWDDALPHADLRPMPYDGDTSGSARRAARGEARLLLSNPDMVHAGLLPHHARWAPFLGGLEWIVLDEMHVYRGIFGSHVANVLRRLVRVARFHGADPRFFLTSATIANPGPLARRLTGRPVRVIDFDGAPHGRKWFVFYNPPVVDERLNIRRSALLEAERLARHFLDGGVQTIVFARSRQSAELVARYIERGGAPDSDGDGDGDSNDPDAASGHAVRSYRGGYMASERRAIEAQLRDGHLRGVVATNALELGIDIGDLDAAVMVGYPGSVASTWQQAGRSGRRAGDSVAVLVAGQGPLDQFIVRHPDFVLGRSPEHARLDPDNLLILLDHVRCAAFELPFGPEEAARPFGSVDGDATSEPAAAHASPPDDAGAASADGAERAPPRVADLMEVLAAQGVVQHVDGRWYWMADAYPAEGVGLRSGGSDEVVIVRENVLDDSHKNARDRGPNDGGRDDNGANDAGDDDGSNHDVLGTVDRGRAPTVVHRGAVYLHGARPFRVIDLDWDAGRAVVRPDDGATYTRASSRTVVTPLERVRERPVPGARLAHGELEVRSRATSYREVRFRTHETVGWGSIDLPEQVHVAGGAWFVLTDRTVDGLADIGRWRFDPTGVRGADWDRQRRRALERDGGRCALCGAPPPPDRTHDVHHIRPYRTFQRQDRAAVPGPTDRGSPAGPDERSPNALDNLITLCRPCHARAERALGLHGALSGVGFALAHVAPLHLMCDASDLGVTTMAHAAWSGGPTVVIYERASGGVGFGEALFELHGEIVSGARRMIRECPCRDGCPACVGPRDAGGAGAKEHALSVLAALDREAEPEETP